MVAEVTQRMRNEHQDVVRRKAILCVFEEARRRGVEATEVAMDGTDEVVAGGLREEAQRLLGLIELAERDAPAIVPELEETIRETLNPPLPPEALRR
jgi:hypothetical protein